MNLSRLSNQALHENFQKLASTEREILTQIILHIQEVHRRKLYLELGYSSLYLYMTEHLKYSSASAMRRIEAAKLVHDIPCVLQKLEEGKINLSQVSLLQHSLKVAQKNKSNISAEYKLELIESLEGLNKQQSEVKLSASLEIPVQKHTSTKYQADESVRVELYFSKQEWEQISEMKELLSHSVQGDLKELMLFMAEKVKKQKLRSNKKANLNLEERTLVPNIIAADSAAEVESKTNGTLTSKAQVEAQLKSQGKNQNSVKIYAPKHAQYYAQNNTQYKTNSKTIMQTNRKAIPQAIQKHIRNKYHSCQYINKHNGQVCTSKWQLQIEHIKPVWAGGDNTIENLSLLCARHNQYQYKVQAGIL